MRSDANGFVARGSSGTVTAGSMGHAEGYATQAQGGGNAAAHAEGQSTVASGSASHAEGSLSVASGSASHAEGAQTTASASYSHAGGQSSTASGQWSFAHGYSALASGQNAIALGDSANAVATNSLATGQGSLTGQQGSHTHASGVFAALGDAQATWFVLRASTTDATPRIVSANGSSSATLTGAGRNVLTIPANRAYRFRVDVVARRSDVSADYAGWEFKGLVGRGSSGSAAFGGTVDGRAWNNGAGSAAWDVTLSINTSDATDNYLAVTVTGEAAKTIRWVACIEFVEVG